MIDFTAEKSLLGSILIAPTETLPIARSKIKATDILHEGVRAAYIAACELADDGEVIDAVTLIQRSSCVGQVVVNGPLLVDCMNIVATAANIEYYADAVHNDSIRRRIREIGSDLSEDSMLPPHELLRTAISQLQELQSGSSAKPESPADAAADFFHELKEAAEGKRRPFLSTGFDKLDALLGGGLVSSGLITLAARPGTGKSVLGLCIAENVAEYGLPVLYISLEMTRSQLMARRVGRMAGLSYNRLQRGDVPEDDLNLWKRINSALSRLSKHPLYISDKPASISDIELKARSLHGLSLIVIDHMGLIKPLNSRITIYQQTTETSHALKLLALSLNVPILSLCQLNRGSEGRPDRRPELPDLRNSGAIEEDSDSVILLHRPAMFLPESDRPKPWEEQFIEIIVAKNRHGASGETQLVFKGMTANIIEKDEFRELPQETFVPFKE